MPMYQKMNKKIGAYVMFEKYNGKTKILNVKQREPMKPFKGIKIKK